MRCIIDTNIFLDVLMRRQPFYADSKTVLTLCEEKKLFGFVTASSVTDIFYLVRKAVGSADEAYSAVGHILEIIKVLTVTNEDVYTAFLKKSRDFEDCLMAVCAKSNKCDGIVTRNVKDFTSFPIDVYTPENIIAIFDQTTNHPG